MSTQFTPCPACGAVGEVNSTCQFCGTTILLKEGAVPYDARIVEYRTVTPQQYAEKISIYHKIESLGDKISKVTIGLQEGIINLNGDLIYPLGNERIIKAPNEIAQIGEKFFDLKNFEYTEDPYQNHMVLEKLEELLNAIEDNKEYQIYFTKSGCCAPFITISSPVTLWRDDELRNEIILLLEPEGGDIDKKRNFYKRLTSCEDFELFESIDEDAFENPLPEYDKSQYILFGYETNNCYKTLLRVLFQVYDILPEDADKYVDVQYKSTTQNGGGCLGMLALLVSVGGAGIYGLTQLISNLIA